MTTKQLKEQMHEGIMWLAVMINFAWPFIYIMASGHCKDLFDWFICILLVGVLLGLAYIIAEDTYKTYKKYQTKTKEA